MTIDMVTVLIVFQLFAILLLSFLLDCTHEKIMILEDLVARTEKRILALEQKNR